MTADARSAGTLDCRHHSIDTLRRTLSADRYGAIQAVIVEPCAVDAAQAMVDHCWHDAAVIIAKAA